MLFNLKKTKKYDIVGTVHKVNRTFTEEEKMDNVSLEHTYT
jgi:hypothetical protein